MPDSSAAELSRFRFQNLTYIHFAAVYGATAGVISNNDFLFDEFASSIGFLVILSVIKSSKTYNSFAAADEVLPGRGLQENGANS